MKTIGWEQTASFKFYRDVSASLWNFKTLKIGRRKSGNIQIAGREKYIQTDARPVSPLLPANNAGAPQEMGGFFAHSPPFLLLFCKKKNSSYRSTKAPRKEICTICYYVNGFRTDPLLGSQRTLKMWGPFLRFLHIQEIFFQPNSFWEAEWVFCEGRRRSGFMCWVTDPHTEALPLSFFQLKVEEKNIRQDVSDWRFGKKYFRPRQMPISDMIGLALYWSNIS